MLPREFCLPLIFVLKQLAGKGGICLAKEIAVGAIGLRFTQREDIEGDLDQFRVIIQMTGALYIVGNVDDRASVKAPGDTVIVGKIGQARLISMEGIILVRQGNSGTDGKTFITAAA